jgi:HEAT repeat protein
LCVELAEIATKDDLQPIPIFVQLKGDKPILTLIQSEFRRAKLRVAADPQQIEFHHQLFQEYYAARHLRSMLQNKHPDLVDDDRLKHFYLNYLKWTEPLGLLLGLLDDEVQALRLVGLGLEVDWFLGVRLAGEVKQGFQPQTVRLVDQLIVEKNLPRWLKLELWKKTQSSVVVPKLFLILKDADSWVLRLKAVDAIVQLGDGSSVPELLPFLQDVDHWVRASVVDAIIRLEDKSSISTLLPFLQDSSSDIRHGVVKASVKLGDKSNLKDLLPLLQDSDSNVRARAVDIIVRWRDKSNLNNLLPLLQDPDRWVRAEAVTRIAIWGNKSNLPDLLPLLQDSNSYIRRCVVNAIVRLGDKIDLLLLLQHPKSDVRLRAVEAIVQLGGETAVIVLTDVLNIRGANMRELGAKGLGKIQAWEEISQLTRSLAIIALLNSLETHHDSIRIAAAKSLIKIGNAKILPRLYQKLSESKDDTIAKIIFALQAKSEFYNYDISCLSLASKQPSLPSLTLNIGGDYVAGDKTQGDKIEGSKTENHFPNATEVKIFEQVDRYYQTPPPPKDSSS